MSTYVHSYDHHETTEIIARSLEDKANLWEEEAQQESLKGAANDAKIYCLKWGASQLRAMTAEVRGMSPFELREIDDGVVADNVTVAEDSFTLSVATNPPVSGLYHTIGETRNQRVMLDRDSGAIYNIQSPYRED